VVCCNGVENTKVCHRNLDLDCAGNMLISNAFFRYSFGTGFNEAVFFNQPLGITSSKVVYGEIIIAMFHPFVGHKGH
jgi:hypothetical protein